MSREVSPRFANSIAPRTYQALYASFYKLFEHLGGINITGANNMPPHGKKVVSANHETIIDPWVMGLVNPESLFSLGKEELGSYKYAFVGRWALAPLMNAVLIKRTGRDYDILENMSTFMIEHDAACQSFIYGTRRPESKGAMPKTGVAHLAIRSSTPDNPTPVVPFGHSTRVWKPGRPIQVVVGEPIYGPPNGRKLPKGELRTERRRITDEAVDSIARLSGIAVQLDSMGAGIPGRIVWND
jgi:1-acyl-sn-glycerol-3-phosphate acyltransferase